MIETWNGWYRDTVAFDESAISIRYRKESQLKDYTMYQAKFEYEVIEYKDMTILGKVYLEVYLKPGYTMLNRKRTITNENIVFEGVLYKPTMFYETIDNMPRLKYFMTKLEEMFEEKKGVKVHVKRIGKSAKK